MPYIAYTEEQKFYANSINLVNFLQGQGEKFKESGNEFRWISGHDSVTVKENKWHRHSQKIGGGPVSFCMEFLNMKYQEAMSALLEGAYHLSADEMKNYADKAREQISPPKEKGEFVLPPKHDDMKRAYAYLAKERGIDTDILNQFIKMGKIYQSAEFNEKYSKTYHNIVFVGHDEKSKAVYATKKSPVSASGFRGEHDNSDKERYCFNSKGTSNKVFVFESPIDMLSYISLHKNNWQEHSYLALGGVAEKPLLHFLLQNKDVSHVTLCLDNDNAGIENMARMMDELGKKGTNIDIDLSQTKDWNEDLKTGAQNTKNYSLFKGEKNSIYVFDNALDMISYMAMRRHIELAVKGDILNKMQTWNKDYYFSFNNDYNNSLALFLRQTPGIDTVRFQCGYNDNNLDAAQKIFDGMEKYYHWANEKGYTADFKVAHNENYNNDFKQCLTYSDEQIKEAYTPKPEQAQSMKM